MQHCIVIFAVSDLRADIYEPTHNARHAYLPLHLAVKTKNDPNIFKEQYKITTFYWQIPCNFTNFVVKLNKMIKIGVIKEGKTPPDERVPFSPEQVNYINSQHPKCKGSCSRRVMFDVTKLKSIKIKELSLVDNLDEL
jgi:hypothetical protein